MLQINESYLFVHVLLTQLKRISKGKPAPIRPQWRVQRSGAWPRLHRRFRRAWTRCQETVVQDAGGRPKPAFRHRRQRLPGGCAASVASAARDAAGKSAKIFELYGVGGWYLQKESYPEGPSTSSRMAFGGEKGLSTSLEGSKGPSGLQSGEGTATNRFDGLEPKRLIRLACSSIPKTQDAPSNCSQGQGL